MDPTVLKRMIEEDEAGLLVPDVREPPLSPEQRLESAYEEIAAFVRDSGREPVLNPADMTETKLAMRLRAMSEDKAQREALADVDELELLAEPATPGSIEELVAADAAGLTADSAGDLFELRNVPKTTTMPSEVGSRKQCEEFDEFRPLLETCQQELRTGSRKLIDFRNEQQIARGRFYVLKGMLLYVAEAGEKQRVRGKLNARLRCIFENGTESDMRLRSLAAELYKNGRRVTEPAEGSLPKLELTADTPTASVYVVRSLSDDPQILAIPDLHKIGSTRQTVEARTAGAPWSATFLGAAVELVAEYTVPRGVEQRVERLLHQLFASARLDAWYDTADRDSEVLEWFSVPLRVIDEATQLIEAESIAGYEYDASSRALRLRSN